MMTRGRLNDGSALSVLQKGSELHWHPSMISPALLRHAEAWSGGELVTTNPVGSSAAHIGHSSPFVLPEAAEVAASIAAQPHTASAPGQASAAGGNVLSQAEADSAGAHQATSHQRP